MQGNDSVIDAKYPPEVTYNQRRFLDMFIASQANELIVTAGSTFSDLIFATSGKLAHTVMDIGTCYRNVHSEPCYFYWREAPTCNANVNTSENLYHPFMLNSMNCYTFKYLYK